VGGGGGAGRLSECVIARVRACACGCVALLIQPATRRHIVMYNIWLHHLFQHYLINGTIFGKKVTGCEMCILAFIKTSIANILILRRIQRDTVINVKTFSCKVPFIFGGF
jgi:hypothetical protein